MSAHSSPPSSRHFRSECSRPQFCRGDEGAWGGRGPSHSPSFSNARSHLPPQVVLETEYDNYAALSLYESLGFIREKRLYRFYLNGKDAFRLVLSVPPTSEDDLYRDDGSNSSGASSPVAPGRPISHRLSDTDDEDESSAR